MRDRHRDQELPARLQPGDTVRLVSPSTRPDQERLNRGVEVLSELGLEVEVGDHALDSFGHGLAGSDNDRLGDLNDALRDPNVRAVFATRGGKGAYRVADRLDFDAVRADPKPLVGFSDITILHLALWQRCRLVTFHGPFVGCWDDEWYGPQSAAALKSALMTNDALVVERDSAEPTAALVVDGVARGVVLGGNLEMMATSVGWCCPSFAGCILLIESVSSHSDVDRVDRSMTQLLNAGALQGVRGVAVGQFSGYNQDRAVAWTVVDVLDDCLRKLGVPVCGGFPLGHGQGPRTLPLGTPAELDTSTGTLRVQARVR
jgi:muramoyltetrapeptide carboxypeptidase